jgi:uncharacterized protein YrrD
MSALIQHNDLLNQVVLDRITMQEVGQVEVVWVYPKVHRVLGFICKSGWLGSKRKAFNLDQVDSIGSNGILTNSPPVETEAEKARQIPSLIGSEVWTDGGDRAGKIIDYIFDLRTGEIEHYLYTSSGWGGVLGSVYKLPSNYILRFGNQRVLVPAGAVESFALHREGIQDKFSKITDLLREEQAQLLLDQAKLRAKSLSEQVKERARTVAEQAAQFVDELELEPDPVNVQPTTGADPDPWDDWEVEPESAPLATDDPWDDWSEGDPGKSKRP